MFAGFNINIDTGYESYYKHGKEIFESQRRKIKNRLDKFILEDGELNGTNMQSTWFPQMNCDIFISHSHKDEELAIAFSGWLNLRFGIEVFIDSCVWGYADDLLEIIDNKFCFDNDKQYYDYAKRNYSTSHVHMMLLTALAMMIDKTECMFFLNTPNSISAVDVINKTQSPWIYAELAITKLVRNRSLKEYRPEKKLYGKAKETLLIQYDVSLEQLTDIESSDLEQWNRVFNDDQYPLDKLYEVKSLLEI